MMERDKVEAFWDSVKHLLPDIRNAQSKAVTDFERLCYQQFPEECVSCFRCLPVALEVAYVGGMVDIKTLIDNKEVSISLYIHKAVDTLDKIPFDHSGKIIVFVVVIEPHSTFKRVGDDLMMEKVLSKPESLFGTAFDLTTLDGRVLTLRTKAGHVFPGTTYFVESEGMPRRNNPRSKGRLYVTFDVCIFYGPFWDMARLVSSLWKRTYADAILLQALNSDHNNIEETTQKNLESTE